jgi:hypothetical protein
MKAASVIGLTSVCVIIFSEILSNDITDPTILLARIAFVMGETRILVIAREWHF